MERARLRRSSARVSLPSKVTPVVDRSSNGKLKSSDIAHRGNQRTAKQRNLKSESGSSSCGSVERQLVFELGRSDSKLPSSRLMKSLLADEMSRETESRRRPPSIIAKLMGLDGLPSQLSSNKQSGRFSDGLQGKTTSAGSTRCRRSCTNQSCRKIAQDQQLFKDVYEIRESLKGRSDSYTARIAANRKQTEDEMAFIRQKFMDAKRLSTDEKLQNSKEFDDTLEVLDSNNHLFLKFLQEPDSLFAKHLHDLHGSHQPQCVNMQNLRPFNVLNYNINAIGCQAGREASQKIDISLSHECEDVLRSHVCHRHAQDSDKSLNFSAEFKDVNGAPTKIVVLKPNFARMQERAESVSASPSSSRELLSDINARKKHVYAGRREDELWGKNNFPTDLEFSSHLSRESKELAKEITCQMRRKLGEGSLNVSWSGYKGYSADESSHDMSGNDSSYDSDVTILTPRTPSRRSSRSKSLPSRYAESSVNREAKKRLSQRWKMTHRFEDKKVASNGSTLGEMLAIPDLDVRPLNSDSAMAQDGSSTRFGGDNSLEGFIEPLGISSKDGWKEGYIATLPRSRSLLFPYDHLGNGEALGARVASKEGSRHGRKKVVKRDMTGNDGASSGSSRLINQRSLSHSSHRISKVIVNGMEEDQIGGHWKNNLSPEEMDSSELKTVILETPTFQLDTTLNPDAMAEAECEIIPEALNSGDHVLETTESSTDGQAKDDSCSSGLHKLISQEPSRRCQGEGSACSSHLAAPPESPASSKEADQPSPVSVLETPFVEYISSGSECFERVSAEIHGLRMQLQLLKLESKAYGDEEGTVRVSTDDEAVEGSPYGLYQPKPFLVGSDESWETSYLANILAELGFDETTPESFATSWHSPDCPIGPRVFERLEKKYVNSASCSRPERRLLFDRINAGIFKISQKFMDPHPWVKPRLGGALRPRWSKDGFGTELWKALVGEEERDMEDAIDLGLKNKPGWMDLRKHVDGIGGEIGQMILDELTSEAWTV